MYVLLNSGVSTQRMGHEQACAITSVCIPKYKYCNVANHHIKAIPIWPQEFDPTILHILTYCGWKSGMGNQIRIHHFLSESTSFSCGVTVVSIVK